MILCAGDVKANKPAHRSDFYARLSIDMAAHRTLLCRGYVSEQGPRIEVVLCAGDCQSDKVAHRMTSMGGLVRLTSPAHRIILCAACSL